MASTSTSSVPVYMLPGVTPVQPSHLEGDPSLATEILPGPPSLVFAQQSSHKREPKKLTAPVSYLPTSDPGSTYSGLMAGSAMGSLEVEGPRRKRARVDKGTAAGRAQRAQARNMNGAPPASDPPPASEASESLPAPIPDSDPIPMQVDSDPPPPPTTATSRSASASASTVKVEDAPLPRGPGRPKGSTKDKGKAKATDGDRSHSRAKEDAVAETSYSPAPALGLNEDHCSACRSLGSLVYCDGCPRAYHLWCLDPPMDAIEDATWFCPSCTIRKNPPPKPAPSFMAPLVHQAQTSAPMEYQLPDEIRGFFKDVSTGPRGSYVDSSEIKQPRLNRHGQLEERDPHRLRDRNGAPVLCFKCETTALPEGLPAAKRSHRSSPGSSSSDKWRSIVSCDYCGLHWHLDCLDPPLPSMPTFGKKWMCPNHADQILKPKRRIPKQNAPPIEIDKPNQFNNGNIEVIQSQTLAANEIKPVAVDEVFINGRRYRVPERVITLDFWNKVRRQRHHTDDNSDAMSGMSSPLTSLSSLEDEVPPISALSETPKYDAEEFRVAQLLCNLSGALRLNSTNPKPTTNGVQQPSVATDPQTDESLLARNVTKATDMAGARSPAKQGSAKRQRTTREGASSSAASRPEPSQVIRRKPSGRRAKPMEPNPSTSSMESLDSTNFKLPAPLPPRRDGRPRRQPRESAVASSSGPPSRLDNGDSVKVEETRADKDMLVRADPEPFEDTRPPPTHEPTTPLRHKQPIIASPSHIPASSSGAVAAPSTPSLKIRLPRLSGAGLAPHAPVTPPAPPRTPSEDSQVRRSGRRRVQSAILRGDSLPLVGGSPASSKAANGNGSNVAS